MVGVRHHGVHVVGTRGHTGGTYWNLHVTRNVLL